MKGINKLINFFFITLIINFFITFYTIYNFLDFKLFQNKQGIKLKIKQEKITYGLKPFDICESNAKLWQYIKIMYIITFFTSNLICSNFVYNKIPIKKKTEKHLDTKNKDDKLKLLIGYNQKTKEKIYIPKSGLFQNFLITGTIGSGKTSSAMYPFTKQLFKSK